MSQLNLGQYDTTGFLDEMVDDEGNIRPHYAALTSRLEALGWDQLNVLQKATERAQRAYGMTFNVYADNQGTERILHLDILPRIIDGKEWDLLERGLTQRITAVNRFIADIYGEQRILKDKTLPPDLILTSEPATSSSAAAAAPQGRLVPHLRLRPHQGRRREVLRPRGQPPLPLRGELHAREPRDPQAELPGGLRGAQRAAREQLHPGPARDARVALAVV